MIVVRRHPHPRKRMLPMRLWMGKKLMKRKLLEYSWKNRLKNQQEAVIEGQPENIIIENLVWWYMTITMNIILNSLQARFSEVLILPYVESFVGF
ncbi:hypothetical protein AVEN_136322-1 [Araneus ventricosus]|uniref:Uncharacterized protein n=1 Tax=Araneus ventricosus TaxID=182803 RepID=A0A4Y2SMM1_ARAVE|nr:hypothetical protein AVEN_136322-1 [Araneus ventricosus]